MDAQAAHVAAVADAKRLMRLARVGALATLDPDTGAPLTTLVGVASDFDGAPLFLLSTLARHTRHVAQDPRVSLLLGGAPGAGRPAQPPPRHAERRDRKDGGAPRAGALSHAQSEGQALCRFRRLRLFQARDRKRAFQWRFWEGGCADAGRPPCLRGRRRPKSTKSELEILSEINARGDALLAVSPAIERRREKSGERSVSIRTASTSLPGRVRRASLSPIPPMTWPRGGRFSPRRAGERFHEHDHCANHRDLIDDAAAPVFIHSSWRTGSTWIWEKLRQAPTTIAYCEVFHERLARCDIRELRDADFSKWKSKHPEGAPYFLEFGSLIGSDRAVRGYASRMAVEDFLPRGGVKGDLTEAERAYLAGLIDNARSRRRIPVLTDTRTLGRFSAIARAFPGRQVLLVRNVFHQWASYSEQWAARESIFFRDAVEDDRGRAPRPVSSPSRRMVRRKRMDPRENPAAFQLFLLFHLYLYAQVYDAADLVIDLNAVASDPDAREAAEMALGAFVRAPIDLSDARPAFGLSLFSPPSKPAFVDSIDQFAKQAIDSSVSAEAAVVHDAAQGRGASRMGAMRLLFRGLSRPGHASIDRGKESLGVHGGSVAAFREGSRLPSLRGRRRRRRARQRRLRNADRRSGDGNDEAWRGEPNGARRGGTSRRPSKARKRHGLRRPAGASRSWGGGGRARHRACARKARAAGVALLHRHAQPLCRGLHAAMRLPGASGRFWCSAPGSTPSLIGSRRSDGLRVFELDHPATQADKRRRLDEANIARARSCRLCRS